MFLIKILTIQVCEGKTCHASRDLPHEIFLFYWYNTSYKTIGKEVLPLTFHQLSPTEAVQELHTNPTSGLSAQQVQEKRSQFGENKLKEQRKKPFSNVFWHNSRT